MPHIHLAVLGRLFALALSLLFGLCGGVAATTLPTGRCSNTNYDYIIVGGGVAGLVVANRLSEDPHKSVLVVEYGYIDNTTQTLWPYYAQGVTINAGDSFTGINSVPQLGMGNVSFPIHIGSVVGGGSIINGMAFDRGTQPDYDSWGELGAEGWNWSNLLPYFRKSATFTPSNSEAAAVYNYTWDDSAWGHGPIQASLPPFQFPEMPTFWEAFKELGVTKVKEGALGTPGAFWVPYSIDPVLQTRSSARTAYYDPVINRTNLHLLPGHYVKKLLFRNHTAEGVKIVSRADNSTSLVYAKKEIILAAGAIHTPQILQLNGIGPSSILEAAGIDTLVDLPGVGANLQDHPVAFMSYNMTNDTAFPNPAALANNMTYNQSAFDDYVNNRDGPYTQSHGTGGAFLPLKVIAPDSYKDIAFSLAAQNATRYLPKIYQEQPALLAGFLAQRQIHINQITSNNASIYETNFNGGGSAITALQKPISRGTISISETNPYGEPIIDYQGLANPIDTAVLREAVKFTRQIFNTMALSVYEPIEMSPGEAVHSDAEIQRALRIGGLAQPSFAHPCCTAAMMPRELGGVVADDLLVYGTQKLSIVDASVMSIIPATHLQATVYAVAEKAADIIKARHCWMVRRRPFVS